MLRVISSSPSALQPVLDALVRSASRLCEANVVTIGRRDGDEYLILATLDLDGQVLGPRRVPVDARPFVGIQALTERRTVHVPDIEAEPPEGYPDRRARAVAGRSRAA